LSSPRDDWYDGKPVRFRYHRFASLPKGGWSAKDLPNPPRGWRWLSVGDWVKLGDLCCDPRSNPVVIVVDRAWRMTSNHHPVLRKVKK
jgi:hypothetical protein